MKLRDIPLDAVPPPAVNDNAANRVLKLLLVLLAVEFVWPFAATWWLS